LIPDFDGARVDITLAGACNVSSGTLKPASKDIFPVSNQTPNSQISISVHELADWRQTDRPHIVLDVREANELMICQLDSAMHIPMGEIPSRIEDVPVDAPVVVMCHHGARSMTVVNFLRKAGRTNVVNLDGGIDAWARQIDNAVRLY
jgi:rhodanese-related sulfurtransferase